MFRISAWLRNDLYKSVPEAPPGRYFAITWFTQLLSLQQAFILEKLLLLNPIYMLINEDTKRLEN